MYALRTGVNKSALAFPNDHAYRLVRSGSGAPADKHEVIMP